MVTGGFLPEGLKLKGASKKEMYSLLDMEKARLCNATLTARATLCDEEQNLYVDLGCMRGMIPREETVYTDGEIKSIAILSRVGKPVCFKIKGFSRLANGDQLALLSRAAAQEEAYREYISGLEAGDVIRGRVTHTEPFGAFVDIGCGIISLLSVDCISVSRIEHPKERFPTGCDIYCVVKSIDAESGRIMLSHRELLGTWEENAALFSPGQTAAGIVRGVESYGVFIELTPNLVGLAEYRSDLVMGQTASVFIKSINPEKMKVKLVIIECMEASQPPAPIRYSITGGHLDRWRYSPQSAEKLIESVFE